MSVARGSLVLVSMVSDMNGAGAVLAERGGGAGSWESISVIWQTALLRPVQHVYMLEEVYILAVH